MSQRLIVASDIAGTLFDHPGYKVGNWYIPILPGTISGAAVAPGTGSIRLYPFYVRQTITLNSLGVRCSTLSAAGNVQAAIYANNASTILPTGNPLASTASMSTSATGSLNSAVSVQLTPGMYWYATNCDNAVAIFSSPNVGNAYLASLIGSATQSNDLTTSQSFNGLSVAQTFGTWPDLTSGSFADITASSTPIVQFKIASVP